MSKPRIAVIGSGLGGLSAAISLAQEGYEVDVYEKNARIGGKLNVLQARGYSFDLGPSILTLPHIFERLFTRSNRRMADYVSLRPLRPHWRNHFEDGTMVDLFPEPERMAAEAEKLSPGLSRDVERFLTYSAHQYDLVDRGYFQQGLDDAWEMIRYYKGDTVRFDLLRSMHGAVAHHIRHPHMRDIFDFFIKYVGSSAYAAPGFMNCLPTIQFRYDLWYVDGGMYNLALGLQRLMQELDIHIHLHAEVTRLLTEHRRITALEINGSDQVPVQRVVSNMEVIPAYRRLLQEKEAFMKTLARFEPACSGLVLDIGLDTTYPQLAHHNFFFSGDQRKHFDTVFRRKELPDDPTLYLVAASKTDPTVAPPGCDGLKILPHIPCIREDRPLASEDYQRLKERVLDKLERMGLTDLRRHIVFEHCWTPVDIQREYFSNGGSIYGVVSDRWKNFAFKAPKHSRIYDNLFFVGGSVNPGGGMPMVVQCGQNVAQTIARWDRA